VRDLSLHILDLMENSIRARATIVAVTIEQDPAKNLLRIAIEDNGPGLDVPSEQATNPFYTTKTGKRTGLGLSLFQATTELAGGSLALGRSELGGLAVTARMQLHHIDRPPLGDLAATFFSAACTNPQIDFRCRLILPEGSHLLTCSDTARNLPPGKRNAFAVAKKFSDNLRPLLLQVS
jgi:signal transduction histidine kinase